MNSEQNSIPLETVTEIANWLSMHRQATVADVMAEFDLTDKDALMILALAAAVIRDLEDKASRRFYTPPRNVVM